MPHSPSSNMCYMLNIITKKKISKQEAMDYSKNYCIGIYDKTSTMANAKKDAYYYAITKGGCACGLYKNEPENGQKLVELLSSCIEHGELILFFYWDDGDYYLYANDVHRYINKTRKKRTRFKDFIKTFMTKEFNGEDIVFIIY